MSAATANPETPIDTPQPSATPATPPEPNGGNGNPGAGNTTDRTFTQADVDRIVNERLEREREKSRKERERADAEREAEKLKADQEWQKLAEREAAKRAAAEAALDAEREQARQRIARAEIKAQAAALGFANPDLAYRLIDHDQLAFDDNGALTNAEPLLKALAEQEPYLVRAGQAQPRGAGETPRPADLTEVEAGRLREASDATARRVRTVF